MPLAQLTDREREVLSYVGQGLTNKEIAQILTIQESTVASHVHKILTKLGVRTRVAAAMWLSASSGGRSGSTQDP